MGKLPTTPNAWSGVPIDSRWTTAQVDGLVAGPRGLLAILGELGSSDMQLSISTDGRMWTLVPNDQFPSPGVLWPHSGAQHLPAVGTTGGFLFVAEGNDVWASEDGYTWQRRADRAQDADLRAGAILAVAAGGPGLVAVGSDNKAWYSEDGSDWTLAEVPAPPTESFTAGGDAVPTIDMLGVTVAGDTLVAWGNAMATGAGGATPVEPVLWTSADGRSWTNVPDVSGVGWLRDVAAGPNGYVAIGGTGPGDTGRIWFSKDGRAWQPADTFEEGAGPMDLSIAATGAGYVAVGGEGLCAVEPCPNAVAAIWTSPDGRSWSRLLNEDLFTVADPRNSPNHSGAWATSVVSQDDHFVVAGAYDANPVVWISGTPGETEAPVITAGPSSDPGGFLGTWISTSDNDGGTQTMTVEPSTGLTVDVVVTDTIATVCSGTSSTMTGSGSVEGNLLVIPAPDYRCDDGTEATTPDGPPLNEQLQHLTYAYDAATDTLSVGIGDVWLREGTEVPTPAPQPSEQAMEPAPGSGTPLGWSSDGTRSLIQKDDQNLFIRHADGSETLVSEQPSEYERFPGSARPAGAAISPDGSRVVFAGLTTTDGLSCHHGALFAVSAEGGPAAVLWESQAASDGGIVRYPTFSPDGTQIAFADGYCDSNHSVWVMNADGSHAHQIVSSDVDPLGATHVHGLAWSPAGDEIALAVDGATYTFAADGSGATQSAEVEFCWPGRQC
ncbi:MAG TPA: hypothetical protein VFU17_02885 [Candidatus Limnocylindrales bacterium]|nr:hypothetical protein [Candidatus Limnocylindrales bacterium]